MTTPENIRAEQRRRETTEDARFEADYGMHTVRDVLELTRANGSVATGYTAGSVWEARACELGLRVDMNGRTYVVPADALNPSVEICRAIVGAFETNRAIRAAV